MIGDIYNFVLYTQTLDNSITTLTFEFDKPSGDFGAYILSQSYDQITYTEVKTRVDYSHYQEVEDATTDYKNESEIKVYFEYIIEPGITDGRILYFKLQAISISNELSAFSSTVSLYIAPTKPSNLVAMYDGYEIVLNWDDISTSTGMNSSFTQYSIYRKTILELTNFVYDTNTEIITHEDLLAQKAVWILDIAKRSIWFGIIETEGEFTLTNDDKIILASDSGEDYTVSQDNLRILIEDSTSTTLIGTSIINSFTDATFTLSTKYIYAVTTNGLGDLSSNESQFPIFTIDVLEAYPYLRSPSNSDNTILKQKYWRYLKEVLIDDNYYDKTQFAIPYFQHEDYNFKGYLGVSNCNLDIFINNIYAFTTSTGKYGEFDINYAFKRGETLITLQARDKLNIKFSRKSAPYSIRLLNVYTWFAALGDQYKEIVDTIVELRDIVDISKVPYSTFVDVYAPFIEFYKSGTEDDIKFVNIATEVFKSFEYSSYDKSLIMILDAFKNNIDEFEHYEIFYNNSLFDTHKTKYAYIPTSSGLARSNYIYGISSVNTSTGAETDVAILRLDRRWWPEDFNGINVLKWKEMPNIDSYRIYRGTTENNLQYMLTLPGNVWIDIGKITPNPTIVPRLYNYTNLYSPIDLETDNSIYVTKLNEILKKASTLTIILYSEEDSEIPELHITRILILLQKLIPPELLFSVIYARNSETQFLGVINE